MSVTDEIRAPGAGVPGPPPDRYYEPPVDRTPPQDIAAEQCVLGGMLLSKDAIADVVEILRAGDFYRPAHATVFDAVLDLYGRGEPADADHRRRRADRLRATWPASAAPPTCTR